ncbi:anti-sigma factor [Streptomyces venezuelae]|uniref:Anti-sigma factor n=1 Tax=Streptomyces venezuelae TaxID=54571 RepID=A0A5P2CVX9_STRVZ|nr:zf-HC2 domain-containing protein [Streptomyces venezuelae]QES46995.1 anti-sigma factor [Streptomyces venezuelae]
MNCNDFVELVTEFLDGALSEDTEQRFIEHLAQCSGCENYLDQFRQTIAATGELTPEGISSDARQHLLSAFRDWQRDV